MAISMQQLIRKLRAIELRKTKTDKPKKLSQRASDQQYFKTARSWADDIYTAALISRNRYKLAFFGLLGLSTLLTLCIMVLVPTEHTELVVAHEGPSGYTWLSTTTPTHKLSTNWARTKSEIAHYVSTRQSYDPLLYADQTQEVALLSSSEVKAEYDLAQSSDNKASPINVLSTKGYRTVLVNNVFPLDSASKNINAQGKHINLAQVNFVEIDHFYGENKTVKTPYSALISWTYNGTPNDPSAMMQNWDGFTVTKFTVQPININQDNP